MNALTFYGRRLERLFYLGLVLSLATYINAFIGRATANIEQDPVTYSLRDIATAMSAQMASLEKSYAATREAKKKREYLYGLDYETTIRSLVATRNLDNFSVFYEAGVHKTINDEVIKLIDLTVPPTIAVGNINSIVSARTKGTKLLNVDVPRLVKMQISGGEYLLPIELLAAALTTLLAPLLVFWTGSLYVTRYREMMLIQQSASIDQTYPHVLNLFPVLLVRPRKPKRNVRAELATAVVMSTVTRIVLVALFLLSLLLPFAYAVYLLLPPIYEPTLWSLAVMAVLVILLVQFIALLVLEGLLGWTFKHYMIDLQSARQ